MANENVLPAPQRNFNPWLLVLIPVLFLLLCGGCAWLNRSQANSLIDGFQTTVLSNDSGNSSLSQAENKYADLMTNGCPIVVFELPTGEEGYSTFSRFTIKPEGRFLPLWTSAINIRIIGDSPAYADVDDEMHVNGEKVATFNAEGIRHPMEPGEYKEVTIKNWQDNLSPDWTAVSFSCHEFETQEEMAMPTPCPCVYTTEQPPAVNPPAPTNPPASQPEEPAPPAPEPTSVPQQPAQCGVVEYHADFTSGERLVQNTGERLTIVYGQEGMDPAWRHIFEDGMTITVTGFAQIDADDLAEIMINGAWTTIATFDAPGVLPQGTYLLRIRNTVQGTGVAFGIDCEGFR